MRSPSAEIAARLDRLPPSRFLRGLILRLSLGGFFELYDLFMTAYVALGLTRVGLFSATTHAFFDVRGFASFIGAGFAGMFVGTLAFGWLSDRFGRKTVFTYALLWYSTATFFMALTHSAAAIDLWRALAGAGIGVELVTIDTYVSELVPKQSRGSAIAFTQFVGYLSVPVAALLAYVLVPHKFLGLDGWRWVALVGSSGAAAVWWIRRGLPESPRWYAARGQIARALAQLDGIERAIVAESGRPLPAPAKAAPEATGPGSWREIFAPAYRVRTAVLGVFNFAQTIGFYGFASWVPLLLVNEGVTFVHSLLYTLAIALVNPLGPLLAMRYADRFERKRQIVVLALAIALAGIAFAHARKPWVVVALGASIALANAWFSCAFHAYQAEVYPTRIRARAVGFVYSWSRFSAIFVGFFIAAVLARYGSAGVFVLVAAAMGVVALSIGLFGMRTSGRALESLTL